MSHYADVWHRSQTCLHGEARAEPALGRGAGINVRGESVSTLQPGWIEAVGKALASKDEAERAEAAGFKPRRCFRINLAAQKESAARGGRLGRRARRYQEDGK